jgi:hypothetical protein
MLVVAAPMAAHHAHTAYNETGPLLVLEGIVKEIHWLLPHSFVYLDVKNDKGEATTWGLEVDDRQTVFGNGVKREDVRAGDLVRVRCFPLRDGTPGCYVKYVTPLHGDKARGHGVEREWD